MWVHNLKIIQTKQTQIKCCLDMFKELCFLWILLLKIYYEINPFVAARTVCLFNKMKWRKIPIKFHKHIYLLILQSKFGVRSTFPLCLHCLWTLKITTNIKQQKILLWAIKDIISIWLHNSSLFALIPHRFASCYVKLFGLNLLFIAK